MFQLNPDLPKYLFIFTFANNSYLGAPHLCIWIYITGHLKLSSLAGQNADQMTTDVAEQFRQCESRCRLRLRRSCSSNPPFCGDCLPEFRERDGLCLSKERSGNCHFALASEPKLLILFIYLFS